MMIVFILLVVFCLSPTTQGEVLCLSCKDVASPAHCHSVAKCGKYDECYMELYANSLGTLRYDFGCKDSQFCKKLSSAPHLAGRQAGHIHVCTECCNDTMCNYAGCGRNGLPAPTMRGPLCFACDSQYKLDDCPEFRECNRGEVCVLQEKTSQISGEVIYTTGCMQASTCTTIYERLKNIAALIGKRNYDNAVHIGNECKIECCDSDFCNRGCNVTNHKINTAVTLPKTTTQVTSAGHVTTHKPSTTTTTRATTTQRPTTTPTSTTTSTTQRPTTTSTTTTPRPTTTSTTTTTTRPTTTSTTTTPRPTTTSTTTTPRPTTTSTTTTRPTTTTTTPRPTTSATTTTRPSVAVSTKGPTTTAAPPTGCVDTIPQCTDPTFLASICHLHDLNTYYCRKACKMCGSGTG